jgi:hypothetical protein
LMEVAKSKPVRSHHIGLIALPLICVEA